MRAQHLRARVAALDGAVAAARVEDLHVVACGCGVESQSGSRGHAILVNEPTESVRAVDLERIRGSGEAESRSRLWRDESEATMRTLLS